MRNYYKILVVLVLFALLAGCFPPRPATIAERITRFEDALNSSGSDLQEHFHPTLTATYALIADETVFSTGPMAYTNVPFSFTDTIVNPDDTADCTFTNAFTTGSIVFTMALYGDDFRIREFTLTIGMDNYTINTLNTGF